MGADSTKKGPSVTPPVEVGAGEGSLWTSHPSSVSVLPTMSADVGSGALRHVREAVEAAESETKRFEGHASPEAMKLSCA